MIPLSKTKAKYIKSLQLKKNRDKEKKFLVEGQKSVMEFLNSDFIPELIVGTKEFYAENSLPEKTDEKYVSKATELKAIGTLKTNNAAIAVFLKPESGTLSITHEGIILALDGINDPGNLGTIVRTADWFGIKAVILGDDSVDPFNPKVISASKGSMCRVGVYNHSLSTYLENYKGEVLAADMTGADLHEVSPIRSGVIIMGSESHGLSQQIEKFITKRITIPILGQAESLNVGVATGIVCYMLTR